MTTQRDPSADRKRHRRVARDCAAMIDLLDELYPSASVPNLNATDREIGAWLGKRELIDRLKTLRDEVEDGGLHNVLGRR